MSSLIMKKDPPKESDQHTPWVEKYRPKNLDDVASQDHAVGVLKKTLQSANLPHMLFYGPPGTGKTSTILALAKELYGPTLLKSRVLELNASDERGISIVRHKVKTFARLTVSNPSAEDLASYPCPPYKLIILDEADSMTSDAQSALRRTMETYSGVTRFCLICNYITRIIDPLASRCSKFRFRPLDDANALARLTLVAESENVAREEGVLQEVLLIANGDLRKAITFMQSAARLHAPVRTEGDVQTQGTCITKASVLEIAGVVPLAVIEELIAAAAAKNVDALVETVNRVMLEGWSSVQILSQIHDRLILDDMVQPAQKSKIAHALFLADKRLAAGADEQIQVLNLMAQISLVL